MEAGFSHLRDAIAEVFARVVEFPVGVLVTVLDAKVTANTVHAKVTLSVFPETEERAVLDVLEQYRHDIKDMLSDRLRLRRIPRLHYTFDRTEAKAEHIERTLHELKEKGEL